jgi:hypothetical protein
VGSENPENLHTYYVDVPFGKLKSLLISRKIFFHSVLIIRAKQAKAFHYSNGSHDNEILKDVANSM